MEFLLNRFRNLTVLLIVVLLQLLLLAYQVKSSQDVRLIRVWSVTAVTPIAKVLEVVRRNTIGLVEDYFVLINVREENRKLSTELGTLKMENQFLKSELQTAERAQALIAFKARTPSRTIPARIIGTGTGANSRVVYVDQGSSAGIMRGMAVVTPDGIVGKVLDAYPTASQVMLITDPTFRAGVTSQKNRVNGTVEGQGQNKLRVNYVENEEKVDVGEMFYTSGDDRIFPRGMPVGRATVVRTGKSFKEIYVVPTGFQNGLEEVLIVVKGEHQPIPERSESVSSNNIYLLDPPKAAATPAQTPSVLSTDADRLREQYKEVGAAQGHEFGEGGPGSRPPNFNLRVEAPKPATTPPASPMGAAAAGAAAGVTVRPPVTGAGSETNPTATAPAKPKPVTLGPDGQPLPAQPKPAGTTAGTVARPPVTGAGAQTNPTATAPAKPKPVTLGPDGQPLPTQPKPTGTTAGTVARPVTGAGSQTNPTATAPAKPKPVTLGPDGQPLPTQPKPTGTTAGTVARPPVTGAGSQTNPTATAPAKPKPVTLGPDGQPLPTQPKPTGTTAGTVARPPVTGAGSQTNPTAPAKPKPATLGPDGQPMPAQPKPSSPITINNTPTAPPTAAKPKPAPDGPGGTAPAKRVTSDDSTINIITPAPKSANPAPAKPKPQQTESSPNP